ncbi:Helix-turn-helix domain-containing protein [Actinoplanes regularis]|uniref:Helix-turn-helix domain-containing protein n=2 Tax=Actinoplanes regularis TaxID=52697 RepID=A0A238YRA9_9ACTN|nr:Helix-turn-helix domain-containing protein [Actinoplanes regularis]
MAQGMNNSAACREVGINRRTGTRWRYGRTINSADGEPRIYPPIAAPKRAVSTRYLFEDERITIADERRAGSSIRAIAALLDRAPSTISREINCNNENTSGLLRQDFPKSSDLSVHTAEDLAAVAAELNNRPHKILGWDTPA